MNGRNIGRLAALALAAIALATCAVDTTSIEDRIAAFLSDLNSDADRNDIWENLHDDIDDAWKSPATWGGVFAYANAPFALTGMSYGDNFAQGTITGNAGALNDTIYFAMKEEEDDDWYIYRIDIGGAQVVP